MSKGAHRGSLDSALQVQTQQWNVSAKTKHRPRLSLMERKRVFRKCLFLAKGISVSWENKH